MFGMLPASKSLEAHNAKSFERNNWLIFNNQFVALNRGSEISLHLHQLYRAHMHATVENLVTIAAARFGVIHGRIGISQNLFGPLISSGAGGDADACRSKDGAPIEFNRLG